MSGQTIIQNYTVRLRYFKRSVAPKAQVIEQEVEEDVEVGMLSRTSAAHTNFATQLLMHGASGDLEQLAPIATKFCEMMIVDDKQRKAIVNDVMACIDLYGSDPVQKDIERFFIALGCGDGASRNRREPSLHERIKEYGRNDPFLLKKAFISYVFHEPITTLETRLSAADIDKYSDMAMWVIDNIIYAPFKAKK